MRELAPALGIRITAAHLNHCIRGKESDTDAEFVGKLTRSLGIPLESGRSSVPRRAAKKGISLEMAAREARYGFFVRVARRTGACVVATAHTADDQAETVLLKLARGAGPAGLSAMAPQTALHGLRVIRPMIEVSRNEIESFLRARDLDWREDESNRDVSFLRNRVRHEILPLLAARLNPRIRQALIRSAEVLREEDAWLTDIAESELSDCRLKGTRNALRVGALVAKNSALRRRILRLWLSAAGVSPEQLGFCSIDRVESLVTRRKGSGKAEVTGRWIVTRSYDRLTIEQGKSESVCPGFRRAVVIPGETVMPDAGLRIITEFRTHIARPVRPRIGAFPAEASVNPATAGRRRLFVRSWTAGDRIQSYGLKGSKKLQDIFVDEKVPVELRGRVPVFECGGRIIWLPGYRIARGWEVTAPEQDSLQIRIENI
jgi:tRNA(Ile)-lysidine synthase